MNANPMWAEVAQSYKEYISTNIWGLGFSLTLIISNIIVRLLLFDYIVYLEETIMW